MLLERKGSLREDCVPQVRRIRAETRTQAPPGHGSCPPASVEGRGCGAEPPPPARQGRSATAENAFCSPVSRSLSSGIVLEESSWGGSVAHLRPSSGSWLQQRPVPARCRPKRGKRDRQGPCSHGWLVRQPEPGQGGCPGRARANSVHLPRCSRTPATFSGTSARSTWAPGPTPVPTVGRPSPHPPA